MSGDRKLEHHHLLDVIAAAPLNLRMPKWERGYSNVKYAVPIVLMIDELRSDEADSIEVLCDNRDFNGHKNNAVICSGFWTDFEEQRYEGDTLLDALQLAVKHRRQAIALKQQQESHNGRNAP